MQKAFGGLARMGIKKNINGYTILEVMLFLAISALIFIGAVVSVKGQAAHTEFDTGMNDLNSKMQSWVNQVSNGFSGSQADAAAVSKYTCDLDGQGYPVLSSGSNERGSNAKCIFLGKAIQVNASPGSNTKIVAYSVLGRRIYTPAAGTPTAVDNIVNANPVAAVFLPDINLSEEYTVPNGVQVKSVTSTISGSGTISDSHLAGFYTTFNGGSNTAANGSQSLMAIQYPFNSNVAPADQTLLDCIKFVKPSACDTPPSNDNPWPMQKWTLCMESTRNSDTASITVTSANGRGAVTTLDFNGC